MSHLRIVSGNPTDEDVAVIVSVVAAASGAEADEPARQPRDLWGQADDRLRPAAGIAPSAFPNLQYGY